MYLLTNGKIVLENEILEGYDLLIGEDIIVGICKSGERDFENYRVIDANNGYITPGFIDIHSDYIETMASPRPTSVIDFNLSLRETEKILLNAGITTMFHSLSFYGKDFFEVKLIRQQGKVKKLMEVISKTHNEKHLIRNRFHARFELDAIDDVDFIKDYIMNGNVHLLSFMDHTPGQGQYRNLEIYKETMKGYKNITDNQVETMVQESQKREKVTINIINEMAQMAKEYNLAIASHDDDSVEKINLVKSIGATISEFPIDMEVARKAKDEGMYIVAGAPNILLGGSHSGNLSAADAIKEDLIDILCSDYYPSALLHSIFILNKKFGKDLCEMFRLATINPARAVNMDSIIGSIEIGKKADLLVIEDINDAPMITSVFVDGNLTSTINYRE